MTTIHPVGDRWLLPRHLLSLILRKALVKQGFTYR
jgi:hypothetical protein